MIDYAAELEAANFYLQVELAKAGILSALIFNLLSCDSIKIFLTFLESIFI
jgi:hypothetical protein